MTAEIAVLNKLAVALAADSAMTLSGSDQPKIYNTVNKLFSLSKYQAVGIMIHGNSEFMGVPWELIIKAYRDKLGHKTFPTLKAYLDDFVQQVETDGVVDLKEEETSFVKSTVSGYFAQMKKEIDRQVQTVITQDGKITDEGVKTIVSAVLEAHVARRQRPTDLSAIVPDHLSAIVAAYDSVFEDLIAETFEKAAMSNGASTHLKEIAYSLFTKESFPPDVYSGIVVAGFGTDDTYPSLEWIMVHGRIASKMKRKIRESTIIKHDMGAAIVPFAQREMVDTFMQGADPRYSDAVKSFLSETLALYPESILATLPDLNEEQRKSFLEKWKQTGVELLAKYTQKMDAFVEEKFIHPVTEAVAALPKVELAAMAETLVNLTSFKRRVTLDPETVGGPIDVAVISKGDGFIWIKRKHYFRPELNPHFSTNYFRQTSRRGDE